MIALAFVADNDEGNIAILKRVSLLMRLPYPFWDSFTAKCLSTSFVNRVALASSCFDSVLTCVVLLSARRARWTADFRVDVFERRVVPG